MDGSTALLMLFAGLLHAVWHAIVRAGSGLPILAGMGLISAALTVPFIFFVPVPPLSLWPVFAFSLALHAAYKVSVAIAYEQGDLSMTYPLARGLIPIWSALLSYIFLSQLLNTAQLIGIAVVSAGALGLAADSAAGKFDARVVLSALAASSMSAGYAIMDSYGTRAAADWWSFTVWLIVLESIVFVAVARAIRGPSLWPQIGKSGMRTAMAGALGAGSFVVFIWALNRNPVAVVVAFRECSVVFATLIGIWVLKETVSSRRLVAVGLITAGLVLIAAWR